jgi:hypothetical protein
MALGNNGRLKAFELPTSFVEQIEQDRMVSSASLLKCSAWEPALSNERRRVCGATATYESSIRSYLLKHSALLAPIHAAHDGTQIPFVEPPDLGQE